VQKSWFFLVVCSGFLGGVQNQHGLAVFNMHYSAFNMENARDGRVVALPRVPYPLFKDPLQVSVLKE
jgi:hypothetical protein